LYNSFFYSLLVVLLTHTFLMFLGNMLTFLVGSKQAFEVSLADVSQTQMQGKNDVILEFHVDDTTGANEVGLLMLFVLSAVQAIWLHFMHMGPQQSYLQRHLYYVLVLFISELH